MRVDRKGDMDRVVYSIRAQNKLINVVEFLNCQEPEEEASEFISRVKDQTKVCEFIVLMSPTAEHSSKDMS